MGLNAAPTYKVTPTSTKEVLKTNYISLFDYTSQESPETHDEIANIYGKQSVSGMLHSMSQESSFASDKYIWTEEGRLHTVYNDVTRTGSTFTKAGHVFRVNETLHISDGTKKRRGVVTAVTANTFTVASYLSAGLGALATSALTVFADGSEFHKGTKGMVGSLETDFSILSNKPIIQKDKYEVNGSDATQIGWVKTSSGGYLWFMESEKDTRRRWEDRLELSLLNGQIAEAGSDAQAAGFGGTEGLFDAIRKRGNGFSGIAADILDWNEIVRRFDAQGKIQDYMMYVDRDQSFAIDDMLGEIGAGYDNGLSYGIFKNGKDMSINLGFKGFTRGSYNFFKTDSKLLNDPTLHGAVSTAAGKTRAFLVPIGTKEVYEGEYNGNGGGEKTKMHYLHSKYRVAGQENRRYKTWVTGTVGGVYTDDEDAMKVNHLSERMLCTVGANNFMIFEGE